jgi:hypothetical protein
MFVRKHVVGLAALSLLALGQVATAAYTVTSSISSVSNPGGSNFVSLAAGSTFLVGGTTITVGSAGGTEFTTAGGSTFYLVNFSGTASQYIIPNEAIYVTGPAIGNTDSSSISFTESITISNAGNANSFTQDGLITIQGDSPGIYSVSSGSISPSSQMIGGDTFTASNPQASSGTINNAGNNGGLSVTISASDSPAVVPEPSSLAMCGLAGVIGSACAWRRRKRVV